MTFAYLVMGPFDSRTDRAAATNGWPDGACRR